MFSHTSQLEQEKQLRVFAAEGKLSEARDLLSKNPGINVDSSGPETGKTAAHRAAEKNHPQLLKLLYNSGANFALTDRQQQSVYNLVTLISSAKVITDLIEKTEEAITTSRSIIPNYITDSLQRLRAEKVSIHKTAIFAEAHKQLMSTASIMRQYLDTLPEADYSRVHQQGTQWNYYIQGLMFCRAQLEVQLEKDLSGYGGCGEMSCTAFAVLLNHSPVLPFSMEQIIISDKIRPGYNHALIVINRPQSSKITDPKTWGDAIVCDPTNKRSYFASEVEQYKQPSLLKSADLVKHNITVAFSTTPPPSDLLPTEAARQFEAEANRQMSCIKNWVRLVSHEQRTSRDMQMA